jgi:AcrR family transcriptional regulator
METTPRPYHHGDLRRALLDAAIADIAQRGPSQLSLRELARGLGVSHAAPRYHFGDKRGLLTAVAVDGFDLLAKELGDSWTRTGSFLEVGVAYVRFALAHRAHFEVMFRPELLRNDDASLAAARNATGGLLYGPVSALATTPPGTDPRAPAIAAWSLVHGLATLWLAGNLPADAAADPESLTRAAAGYLFAASGPTPARDPGTSGSRARPARSRSS